MDKYITTWFSVKWLPAAKNCTPNIPDMDDYSLKLKNIYVSFDEAGYDVVNIIPINIGQYDYTNTLNWGYGYGFGTTNGAIVVGKLR